jgi:DNA-binding NtrC family response regulator
MSIHYQETNRVAAPALPSQEVGGFRTREEFARFLRHAETVNERGQEPASLRAWLELAEAWRITQALRQCKGNRSAAARLLGIGRRTLYAKMDKLGITPTWSF